MQPLPPASPPAAEAAAEEPPSSSPLLLTPLSLSLLSLCLPPPPPPTTTTTELPVSGRYSGIGQGVLRVSAAAPDAAKAAHLRRAYKQMSSRYPGRTLYATLTANVVLRSTTPGSSSFSVYFGQSFGSARSIYYGQEHDRDSGRLRRLFAEFSLGDRSDLSRLPLNFTQEDFAGLYKRNFERSNVAVHQVISLVYLFSVGLENYAEARHEDTDRHPLRLF